MKGLLPPGKCRHDSAKADERIKEEQPNIKSFGKGLIFMTKETNRWKVTLLGGHHGVVVNKVKGWQKSFIYHPKFDTLQFVGGRVDQKVPGTIRKLIKDFIKEAVYNG